MRSKLLVVASLAAIAALVPSAAGSAVGPQAYVEVWTDRGEGEIYSRGEAIDIYVEPSFDSYVLVYTIDTDGYINVVFPYDCRDDGFLTGGRTYRIVTGADDGYYAEGTKGVAYVRAVASATPIRRLYWPGCPGYERYAEEVAWTSFADYWGPALPRQIYGDPYVAMQSIDEFICWDAVNTGAVSVGYTYYYVMEVVERPVYYVRAGWRWPHTWYWPGSSAYWDACWDACWGFSVRLGAWYPCGYPYGWSWCAPTWCAPSWCWPSWYRPCYASCGTRYTCCRSGGCGSCTSCTGSVRRTYPSQVKYKTSGLAGGAVSARKSKSGEASREFKLYTQDDGASVKRKTYATDEDREGLRRVKQVSSDASSASSERGVKGKTSRKIYSTEGSRSAAKKAVAADSDGERTKSADKTSGRKYTADAEKSPGRTTTPVKATSERKKTVSTTTYKNSEDKQASRKATVSKKSSSSKSSSVKTTSKPRTQSKASNAGRSVKASSSSSGSSGNHRGSPTTRRSISR